MKRLAVACYLPQHNFLNFHLSNSYEEAIQSHHLILDIKNLKVEDLEDEDIHLFCTTIRTREVPIRRNKKKRIQKKYNKLYGTKVEEFRSTIEFRVVDMDINWQLMECDFEVEFVGRWQKSRS